MSRISKARSPSRLAARARAGQGKPLSVRFAHSPGFSGMVYPTWSVKAAENPGAPLSGGILLPSAGTRPGATFAEGFYSPAVPTAPPPSRLQCERDLRSPPPSRLQCERDLRSPPPGLACQAGKLYQAHPLPPPVNIASGGRKLSRTGGGYRSIISFQRGERSLPPLATPFFRTPPPSSLKQ